MIENFKYGNISDTGSVSTVNEDYYGSFDTLNGKVFVLCDGTSDPIGGHVASKTAVEAVREYFDISVYNNLIISLNNALVHANNAVHRKIEEEPELNGMSTTCLIVIIKENKVYYAATGDSRIYYFRDGKCMLISGGHSTVSADAGAETNPLKKGLGMSADTDLHICNEPLHPEAGDLLLLCSAGLTVEVVENFSIPVIFNKAQDLQMRVADLVKLADKNQTADNITLQLIEFGAATDKIKNNPINLNTAETTEIKHVEKSPKAPVVLPIILLLLITAVIYFGLYRFKNEDSTVTVSTETKTDSTVTKAKETSGEISEDSALSAAQFQAETDKNKYPLRGNAPQLPPVNTGISMESGMPENMENPVPVPGRMSAAGTGEAYVYTMQKEDDENALKKKFGKSWEQLKSEDHAYTEAVPKAGKELRIYGYIFFASGSEREKNENIENALKSSPGLRRENIIEVPGGILIP